MSTRTLRHWGCTWALLAVATSAWAADDRLARARQLYNARQYDAAITLAREIVRRPAAPPAAAVVLARAHLERHRSSNDQQHLTAAREALVTIDASKLVPSDRAELLVGWAELHYLEGKPDVAADLFEAALASPPAAQSVSRDRLLDWWAHCVERAAEQEPASTRERAYGRILGRVERELERGPDTPALIYWLTAAARGAGDLDRSWQAARAGWIRARIAGGGETLRHDLDRLVLEALIPERARRTGSSEAIRSRAAADMRAEWELLKRAW